MVRSYLEKCRQELQNIQIDLLNQIQRLDMMRKEKIEMIQYIEASEDESYDSFSPQNLQAEMNQKSIARIENEIEQYQQDMNQLLDRQRSVQSRIDEMDAVILDYREEIQREDDAKNRFHDWKMAYVDIVKYQESELQDLASRLDMFLEQGLGRMKNRVELCNKLMDVDRDRCRLELKNMSDSLNHMISDGMDFVSELYPLLLQKDGIYSVLKRYAAYLFRQFNVAVHIDIKDVLTDEKNNCYDYGKLADDIFVIIYRIVQKVCDCIIHCFPVKNIWITIGCDEMIDITFVCDFRMDEEGVKSELGDLCRYVEMFSGRINIDRYQDNMECIEIEMPKNIL